MAENSKEYGTVLGPDARFKGDLEFEGAARFLGSFEGSIKSKGRVHVADGANCKATIDASEVSVEGSVEGNVLAGDRIEIKPTGVITGDIQAARMTMAEGASINGHLRIGTKPLNGAATNGAASTSGGGQASSPGGDRGQQGQSQNQGQGQGQRAQAKR